MASLSKEGFILDLAVSIFPSSYRTLLQLIADAGLEDQIQPTSDLMGVMVDGVVHRSRSRSPVDFLRSSLLSWSSKLVMLRAVLDAWRARSVLSWDDLSLASAYDGESAAAYARRRLNDEVLQRVVEPMCRNFCLVSADEVSAVNLLFMLRHFAGVSFFNSSSGVDFLPRALAAQLEVRPGCRVVAVRELHDGVDLEWHDEVQGPRSEPFGACVVALPAPDAAVICERMDADRAQLLRRFSAARSIGVQFALAVRPEEPVSVLQIPRSEHPDLVGIVFEHNKAPGRAPQGKGLISTIWSDAWGRQYWDRNDADIAAVAESEVNAVCPGLLKHILFTHVQRWRRGPQIPRPGIHRAMQQSGRLAQASGRLQFAGDYLSSSSTNAAARSGELAAEAIRRQLIQHHQGDTSS